MLITSFCLRNISRIERSHNAKGHHCFRSACSIKKGKKIQCFALEAISAIENLFWHKITLKSMESVKEAIYYACLGYGKYLLVNGTDAFEKPSKEKHPWPTAKETTCLLNCRWQKQSTCIGPMAWLYILLLVLWDQQKYSEKSENIGLDSYILNNFSYLSPNLYQSLYDFFSENRNYSIFFWPTLPVHSGSLKRNDYPKQLSGPPSFFWMSQVLLK